VSFEQIETFLDLCETRSFNRTAMRLGVTQSTVSGRVRALEEALGCRLLDRSRAGTSLTTEGLRFEPHARALQSGWTSAQRAVRGAGDAATELRVGIQQDLLDDKAEDWVQTLQDAVPDASLYIEADNSNQMCLDVHQGHLDLAIHYTPKPNPDLHFEMLGAVDYVMVSTDATRLQDVRPETYILTNYAPAFSATHHALLPMLSAGALSGGHNAVIRRLLSVMGGTTYVLRRTALEMERAGQVQPVSDAPRIEQPIYAAVHLRNRHRAAHRRILKALTRHMATRGA